MSHTSCPKKQNDAQLNLYRLMRLENRDSNFVYHDPHHKVTYQHFPLETISLNDLLRLFWKFITTHHFQKIDQEEKYKVQYLHTLFGKNSSNGLPNLVGVETQTFKRFLGEINAVVDIAMISPFELKGRAGVEDAVWMKKMLLAWAHGLPRHKKTKKIAKAKPEPIRKGRPPTKANKNILLQLRTEQAELQQMIDEIDFTPDMRDDGQPREDIDEQILRLQRLLQANREENKERVSALERNLMEEQERMAEQEERESSGEDASCIEWLLHILEQKQIAQSITKVSSCERSGGESKFMVHFEPAMNIAPHLLSESQLKRINQLRQISLFKFYKTGVKSIYSYACHNYSGLADLQQNRMNLARFKDKDYLQAMKKGLHLNPQTRQQLQEFDVCHHCKYIYPAQLLTTCKFVSDRQAMPKTSEAETDLHSESNLQRGRVSHRFVSKHRNCFSGYAKINEEYVCGRKFCKSCIKDCYGVEWMKNHNGICPFCLGVCSCTRCLRHEKMNKLKSFFMSLGGDLGKLQEQSQMERLPIREDPPYFKLKAKLKKPLRTKQLCKLKTKTICKQNMRRLSNLPASAPEKRAARLRYSDCGQILPDEQTQRWSSTAQKQLFNLGRRVSQRKSMSPLY